MTLTYIVCEKLGFGMKETIYVKYINHENIE